MTVEIICVGTELLLGNIINTNASFLAQGCAQLGLSCFYQSVVGDNVGRLRQTIHTACNRSDIILLSGGLGPTKDDLTKETVAEEIGLSLVEDQVSRNWIADYFSKKGKIPTDNNWKQALIPEGAMAIPNPNGTAPGVIIEKNGTRIILMPGPPNEICPMFTDSVMPYLRQLEQETIASVTVKLVGIGESSAETMVQDLMEKQTNPTLAPYAKTSEVHFRVTAKAENEEACMELCRPMVQELKKRFGNHIYTTDVNVTLEKAITDILIEKKLTMTTAESCSGGMIAARMINVPGVSEVFKAGFVTYANEAKMDLLGVSEETLKKYGAVSRETAEEMVIGSARRMGTEVAISVTGIAGPDGGTREKPVGLVYIGCFVCGKVFVNEYLFSGNRMKIRETVTATALVFLRDCLLSM